MDQELIYESERIPPRKNRTVKERLLERRERLVEFLAEVDLALVDLQDHPELEDQYNRIRKGLSG